MGTPDVSELARALAARRTVKERACAVCGKVTMGYGNRRYCGKTCQMRAWRTRKRLAASDARAGGEGDG